MNRRLLKIALLFLTFYPSLIYCESLQPARRPLDIDNPNPPLRKSPGGIQGLEDPRKRRLGRRLASLRRQKFRKSFLFLGPYGSFEGPLAKVSSGDTLSRGIGFGGGIGISYLTPWFQLSFQPAFRQLRVGRKIDGSGVLVDPTPAEFQQTIKYVGASGRISTMIEEGGGPGVFEPTWWFDGGTEVLFPIGDGVQTSSVTGDLKFKANKLWLVLLGSTLDFETPSRELLKLSLHLFYNLPSTSDGRLFGVRAQIAFEFGLL